MERKVIVITGGSGGLGAAAARRLSADGHQVVVIGRSAAKTEAVARQIGADFFLTDFMCLANVRSLAERLLAKYPRIDVLASSVGGIYGTERRVTPDGHEITFQVNYLAGFLLTNLLLDRLIDSRATVVSTCSVADGAIGHVDIHDLENEKRYSAPKAYADSKLAQILFTRELHRRYGPLGLAAAAFRPVEIAAAERTPKGSMILVVEDEPAIRQIVERTLAAKGYAVAAAQDGAEALDQAERLVPDLVLLDVMLPKVHGFEVCRRIRANPRTRHVPVVMMTGVTRGWGFAQDAKDSCGAEDYIEKPFRMGDLLRRVAAVLATGGERASPGDHTPTRRLRTKSPGNGADTLVFLAEGLPGVDFPSGAYFVGPRVAKPSDQADDPGLARELWEHSQRMIEDVVGTSRGGGPEIALPRLVCGRE